MNQKESEGEQVDGMKKGAECTGQVNLMHSISYRIG